MLDDKAIKMFRLFSRIEYCLKRVGFHKDSKADPDWDAFADSDNVVTMFANNTDEKFLNAVKYIKEKPPKKQVIRDGKLAWNAASPGNLPDSRLLLTYVRRIRNNLFHGGKFNGDWFEPDRSEELIDSALAILEECVKCSADITDAYKNGVAV